MGHWPVWASWTQGDGLDGLLAHNVSISVQNYHKKTKRKDEETRVLRSEIKIAVSVDRERVNVLKQSHGPDVA